MVQAANLANGAVGVASCGDGGTGWAVEAQLKTSTDFICVDSQGNSATTSASSITAGASQSGSASDCVCDAGVGSDGTDDCAP
jgi:hypothetical protein